MAEILLFLYLLLSSGLVGLIANPCCCAGGSSCECNPATVWTVVITGTTDFATPTGCTLSGGTPSCANLDGTYILAAGAVSPTATLCDGTTPAGCRWKYTNTTTLNSCLLSPPCSPGGVCVTVLTNASVITVAILGGDVFFGSNCRTAAGGSIAGGKFAQTWGHVPDCTDYASPVTIPWSSNSSSICQFSTATCTVSVS